MLMALGEKAGMTSAEVTGAADSKLLCRLSEAPDARCMSVQRGLDKKRFRDFRAVSQELTEHDWGDLPVEGPRTASWAVKYVAEHYGAPLARHARFFSDDKLGCQGAGVPEHYSLMQALQLAITVDQLQVGELACFEVLVRRSQMAELKHRAKFCPSVGTADDPYSDAHLNMGYR